MTTTCPLPFLQMHQMYFSISGEKTYKIILFFLSKNLTLDLLCCIRLTQFPASPLHRELGIAYFRLVITSYKCEHNAQLCLSQRWNVSSMCILRWKTRFFLLQLADVGKSSPSLYFLVVVHVYSNKVHTSNVRNETQNTAITPQRSSRAVYVIDGWHAAINLTRVSRS